MLDPLPTHHLPSLSFWFSCLMIFLQHHDWWGLGVQSRIEDLGNYLALKVLATREWGLCWILQNCFANIAWFIKLNFLKPRPPVLLGWQILFQLIKCIFLTPWSWPHQKFLVIASIWLQILAGTRKQEKVYKGKEWSTEFIRVAWPACESSLAFHPWSLDLSFSTRKLKSATLLPLNLKLRPRYLEGTWTKYLGLWFMNNK